MKELKDIEFGVKTKKGHKKARISGIQKTHPRGVYSVDVAVGNEVFNKGLLIQAKNKPILKKKMKTHVNKLMKKYNR